MFTRYGFPEVLLEPPDELVERREHLLSVADPFWRHGRKLILGRLTRQVSHHKLTRELLAGRHIVRNPGEGKHK